MHNDTAALTPSPEPETEQPLPSPLRPPCPLLIFGVNCSLTRHHCRHSTGLWALAFADAFPCAEVIGTDLSPIQPTAVPPNLRFEVDDCTRPWTFAPDSFDYIHIRCLSGSVADWPAFYAECMK